MERNENKTKNNIQSKTSIGQPLASARVRLHWAAARDTATTITVNTQTSKRHHDTHTPLLHTLTKKEGKALTRLRTNTLNYFRLRLRAGLGFANGHLCPRFNWPHLLQVYAGR